MKEHDFEFDENIDDVIDDILQEETIEPETKTPRKKRVQRNYINNDDFIAALVKYKSECVDALSQGNKKPQIPNYIGECFTKLSNGLSQRPNFFGYSYRDEMVSDAIINCLLYFENFNPNVKNSRGYVNAFGYFTQIIWYCFLRRIHKEHKQQYIKYKSTENFGIFGSDDSPENGIDQVVQSEVYSNMYDFIKKFEEAEQKKSAKLFSSKKTKISGIEKFLED